MVFPNAAATMEYVIDMLGQLSCLAQRDGLDVLSGRIETVIAAEQADASIKLAQITTAREKNGPPDAEVKPT